MCFCLFTESIHFFNHSFQHIEIESGKYDHLKEKPIVTYCTGGIRCEILSAVMKNRGFNEVYQIEGGIVRYFRRPDVSGELLCGYCNVRMYEHGWIDTLEGGHIVCPGDWIITGIKGEHYPCKPDIFESTYELA